MSRRIFNLFIGLYPRRWRDRYADELYDLCEELINEGDATRFRIATAIIVAGTGQHATRSALAGSPLVPAAWPRSSR